MQPRSCLFSLHEMRDMQLPIAWQKVNNRNLYHSIAPRLLSERCSCHIHENLSCKSGIVDRHREFHTLVLGLSRNALANEMNTMTHVTNIVYRRNLENVCLIRSKIRVCLDGCSNLFETRTLL